MFVLIGVNLKNNNSILLKSRPKNIANRNIFDRILNLLIFYSNFPKATNRLDTWLVVHTLTPNVTEIVLNNPIDIVFKN